MPETEDILAKIYARTVEVLTAYYRDPREEAMAFVVALRDIRDWSAPSDTSAAIAEDSGPPPPPDVPPGSGTP